jgi:hypothetical protein
MTMIDSTWFWLFKVHKYHYIQSPCLDFLENKVNIYLFIYLFVYAIWQTWRDSLWILVNILNSYFKSNISIPYSKVLIRIQATHQCVKDGCRIFWLNYYNHQKSFMLDFDYSLLLIHGIIQELKDQTFCLRAPTHLANP